ncbi:YjiH family protein [Acetohalobium arabaticum]|uniref:Nucleoside recognition domain protein n=1 Tax=Acetohalobium arabaticum (strain ATCC 49924 / DSM 5501 / Z-7288) TaxID=574087 RepID=D9QR61_ACEAZ|nr:YjiH family protein [Acetohalobium arabaticum]ADL13002.1 nucleoside recognition domain protein [Acetohalobium arabaticum DSM 5501]
MESNLEAELIHNQVETDPEEIEITTPKVLKFLIPSLIGIFMFLCPVPYDGAISTPVGVISEWLAAVGEAYLPIVVTVLITFSAVVSTLTTLFKPKFIINNALLNKLFYTKKLYLVFRVLGAIFAILVLNKVGVKYIYSSDTGGTMMSLISSLVTWFFSASFLMPLLMEFGAMDYTGTVVRSFVKPLFTLPGRAAIDLVTSWVGNCDVGVVLTRKQYNSGFYTGREAATIGTCFSAVSLPFCLVVAALLEVDALFIPFYATVVITGMVSVMIMSRIPPLSTLPDTYHSDTGKQIDEEEPEGMKKSEWALRKGIQRAEGAGGLTEILSQGAKTFLNIIFTLSPLVMAWGTIALIIATFTPIFDWLSLPFGYYLQFLGVPEAFKAAPATIVGFADMFIPAILASSISSLKTRFIIGVLSLVQIIYMTEVGTLLVTSDIPVTFKDLAIIFLEKTVIVIPLIVLLTNLFI